MKSTEAAVPVATSKRHTVSPLSTKRPRVRKLLPLALHHSEKAPPPPPLSPAKPHVDVLGHLQAEADRLRSLMGVAVAARDLKQVEAIMEQLLTLVERRRPRSDAERHFNDQVLAYLDVCDVDLKALVQQEERERKHQRLVANALMQQATALLHGGSATGVDEAAVCGLLDQAEHAYRRARDKRADCLPAIRHRVAAEATLTRATRQFDCGDVSGAIATAHSASDQYEAYRKSPSYQGSQILLSLSDPSDAWEEAPLRDLGHAHDDLERCFANVDEFFRDKARGQTKVLFAESKLLADEKRFAEARDAAKRCDALYLWLAEPLPLAQIKWKRQLARLVISQEMQQLEKATVRETTSQLIKWAWECDAGTTQREDLVESGVVGCALKSITSVSVSQDDDPSARELAAAVFALLMDHILPPDTASRRSALRQFGDTKTVIMALLQLAAYLEADQSRIRVLRDLSCLLDTKQSAHVAIHKCEILTRWTRLRDSHSSSPDVLVELLRALHCLLEAGFPAFSAIFIESKVVRGAISTMARHFKHMGVASVCLEIFVTLCKAREHCVSEILTPGDAGMSSAITQALRFYTQQSVPPSPQTQALVVGLATIISTLCEQDLVFAKAVDASKVPSLVSSLGPNPPWQMPSDLVTFFEPRQFSRIVRENQLPKRASSRILVPKNAPEPKETVMDSSEVARVCLVRFGASYQAGRRRHFCVVRFLVPDALAPRADQCRLEVTTLLTRVQTQVYAFPRDGVYSVAVLRRELTRATPARVEFFRTLVASLLPAATTKRTASSRNTLKM